MQITGKTKIVGVIGDPIEHSCSPQMHNAAFEQLSMDYVYVAFHVKAEDLKAAVDGFKALNIVGINVTIPHKQGVIPLIDKLSREAELIGAVNTLVFKEGTIEGHNTDARGFIAAMKEAGVDVPRGESVVILGAGGAARAVVVSLALEGVKKISIANRTASRAIQLASDISQKTGTEIHGMGLDDKSLPEAISESSLLVNTASAGMDLEHPLLIDENWLHRQLVVYDIIYNPPETRLMKVATEKGSKTIGGIGMLVHQGAIAFELWTGQYPPVDVMRQALMNALDL
ncbi:TPA: shikimate dehydrogenase [Candidatus Poribacteria bacterium]|nr:shikimate dehydrogenase [Candidatus Poribacteria bacterium]